MDRATQITMPDGTKTSNAYRVDGNLQVIWDEENRLRAIADNGYVSSYFYDASGARTVKLHGSGEGIHVNSAFSGGYTNNVDYTLYVDAYMVLEKGGQYTKHIYIGDQRIVSKLGDVGSFGVDPRREEYAGANVAGVTAPNYKTKYEALQNVIKDNYQLFEVDYYGIDNDNYVDGDGFCCEPKAQTKNARSLPTENVDYEKLQYYYHSDHLGSASYITNLDGEVIQHIEYVPFGEVFLEERNNTWNTPFLFNGKELDEETGLYYYGARYYNPRISLWYGVDPLAEKYPGVSAYAYCVNNPVMLIDPDGRETKFWARFWGGLQMVGGAVEVVGGVIGIVTPEPSTTIGGVLLVANGVDNTQTGARQLWTGESKDTMLHLGVETGAEALGASPETANRIAMGADISTILIGNGASIFKTVKALRAPSSASRVSKLAQANNIYSSQGAVVKSTVDKYYKAMKGGSYKSEGAAGFFHDGKIILTEGNHRMNAALKYADETGNSQYVEDLINKGNFIDANPADYGFKIKKLPTSD